MKKYTKNWRAELTKELNDINMLHQATCQTAEEAYNNWRLTKSRDEFAIYSEMDDFREELEKSISDIELMLGDKIYMSQYLWSDVKAFEVVEVIDPNHMVVRRLKATLTPEAKDALHKSFIPGGFCGHTDNSRQEWTFESDETEPLVHVRRHKNGKFYEARTKSCPYILHKEPYEWYDYNF